MLQGKSTCVTHLGIKFVKNNHISTRDVLDQLELVFLWLG